MQAPIYGRAHTQVRPYRNRATTGGCPYMSSGAGGQGDAFHPGQLGGDGPDEHLGFHEHGDPRRIVGDPQPDITLVQEEAFERHDGEDAEGVELAEWAFDPFRPLDLQLKPVVLLVVVDIDDRGRSDSQRRESPAEIEHGEGILDAGRYLHRLGIPVFRHRRPVRGLVEEYFDIVLAPALPPFEEEMVGIDWCL